MKKVLLMSAMALFVFAAQAQVKFGATAGLNLANISQNYKESSEESDTKMRLAPRIGVVVDYGISDALSFRSGLAYTSKGFKTEESESETIGGVTYSYSGETNVSISYLEIPITGVFKTGAFEISAGPYLAFGIGGKYKSEYSQSVGGVTESGEFEADIAFTSEVTAEQEEDDKAYMKGLDYGLALGIGYNAGPGVIRLTYSKGLSNLEPKYETEPDYDPADYKITNSVIGLSFIYFFGM